MNIVDALAACDIRNYQRDVIWVPSPDSSQNDIPEFTNFGSADINGPFDALFTLFSNHNPMETRDYIGNPISIVITYVRHDVDGLASGHIRWHYIRRA